MKPLLIAAAAIGGAALLFYLAVQSAPPSPPAGVPHSAEAASRACRDALRDTILEPSFPFAPTSTYLGDEAYHLAGTVDAVVDAEPVRRQYDCWVRYVPPDAYRLDSLSIWQSH